MTPASCWQVPHRRRPGRLPAAAGSSGRARRHRGDADPGGHRDQPRPAGRHAEAGPRRIFAVNPMAASRYRDRHGVSRKKSDPGDALVLANIIRTDAPVHRPLPADTDLAQAVAVLARAQQDAVWNRQQVANQLRSLLREYFPAMIEAFRDKPGTLTRPDALRILAVAPTPALAAKLQMWKLTAMLRRAGRRRGIETDAERIQQLFREEAPRQLPLVEDAMGKQALALLLQLDAACQAVDDLARSTEDAFRAHPDAAIMLSFPGIGPQVGARILGEIGDDRSRFATAGGLKAYADASASPTTTSSARLAPGSEASHPAAPAVSSAGRELPASPRWGLRRQSPGPRWLRAPTPRAAPTTAPRAPAQLCSRPTPGPGPTSEHRRPMGHQAACCRWGRRRRTPTQPTGRQSARARSGGTSGYFGAPAAGGSQGTPCDAPAVESTAGRPRGRTPPGWPGGRCAVGRMPHKPIPLAERLAQHEPGQPGATAIRRWDMEPLICIKWPHRWGAAPQCW